MRSPFCWFALIVCAALPADLSAAIPPLLAQAIEQWAGGREDLAFTQKTTSFFDDGQVRQERLERYDPSLADSQRWRLLEIDGRPATDEQREKWETRKNGKPRKKVVKSPAEYLDLDHAQLLDETPLRARFAIDLRAEAARLLAVENISVVVTVDKASASLGHITASLRQPINVLLGLARITDLDIDVSIEPGADPASNKSGQVQNGSTARVTMSKLGYPMEYHWSEFKRVNSFGGLKPGG